METTYENVIEEIVQNIYSTMLNIDLVRDQVEPPSDQEHMLASVQIAGDWMGSAVLALSPELATEAASSMLGIPPTQVGEDDLSDVAAELVNMIGGNLKSILPGPSYLSLPTVFTANDFDMHIHNALLIEDVCLRSAVGSMRVRLYAQIPQLDGTAE